ncbi:efflux RND transporter permease subunit, partial [Xylella fastidiosa subsp. multiplex]|nr:efflux RND transporter permease subunit [Xylella fastidiosa subsp. multiplex]
DNDRQFEDDVSRLSVRSTTGRLVPLSAFSSIERTVGPTSVNHQGQLQAVTVSFNLGPDVPLGNATAKIDRFKDELKMPQSII